MPELVLAYIAGLLTTLNPCVLPMLPLVLAGAATGGRLGPVAFAAGMTSSFTIVGVFIASIGIGLGITSEVLRQIAAVMFVAFGLVLLVPPLQARFAVATAGLATYADTAASRVAKGGVSGPFLIGALAGAIWSPCSGPSLGAAIALAAESGGLLPAALRMFVFSLGATTVLLALAYGTRSAILSRRHALSTVAGFIKPVAGALFAAVGIVILAGIDKQLETALLDRLPEWLTTFTTRF